MSMTRKHFIDLAEVVVEQAEGSGMTDGQFHRLIDNLALVCQKHNSNFSHARFLEYVLARVDADFAKNDRMTKETV